MYLAASRSRVAGQRPQTVREASWSALKLTVLHEEHLLAFVTFLHVLSGRTIPHRLIDRKFCSACGEDHI